MRDRLSRSKKQPGQGDRQGECSEGGGMEERRGGREEERECRTERERERG